MTQDFLDRRDGIIRKERPPPYRKTAFFPVGATQQNRQARLTQVQEPLPEFDVRRKNFLRTKNLALSIAGRKVGFTDHLSRCLTHRRRNREASYHTSDFRLASLSI
jgi:hypothetical protein